jgi:hypothetical protein
MLAASLFTRMQVLIWLLENLVLWFVETGRIKTFRRSKN